MVGDTSLKNIYLNTKVKLIDKTAKHKKCFCIYLLKKLKKSNVIILMQKNLMITEDSEKQ